ncbi:MAG TPA: alpha/beta fold hydrolase, partial [Solirubrobacteraceae bacterium]|nr:alpha/beta fold hydrolase [Solirubrobacteraceae bacterium]
MREQTTKSSGRRAAIATAATAATAGLAAAAVVQRRHLRGLARDEQYAHLTAPLAGSPFRVTSADGTSLYAEAFGDENGPVVVFAHGWTEQLSFWGPVIRLLEHRGLRLIAYDLRGHGRSAPAADGDYALARFGEDVEAVLQAVVPGDRATVVGHSLGAISIAAWAAHHESIDRGRAAALVNTGLGDLLAGHLLLGEAARFLNHPWASRAVLGSRLRVPPFSTPLQQRLIRYAAFGPQATSAEIAFYERMLIACPADVRAACGVALSDIDLWHAVQRLSIPTLVVAGECDRLTPPAHARRIAEGLPMPVGLIELPDTGHMSPLERPRELSDALAALALGHSPLASVPAA